MIFYIKEPEYSGIDKVTAKSKAREDAEIIFNQLGYHPINLNIQSKFSTQGAKRVLWHISSNQSWELAIKDLSEEDFLILQYPSTDFSLLLPNTIAKLKCKLIILIHDWERFRYLVDKNISLGRRIKLQREEMLLRMAHRIIVHNPSMINKMLELGFDKSKLISLDIFDYLINDYCRERNAARVNKLDAPIIVAGNLSANKAGYVYELPSHIRFNLYGAGYTGEVNDSICYKGTFKPEELPYNLDGSFGLVWDGHTSRNCEGPMGEYLRINNPHKTSLYLASGIPVVIWRQAALAGFIEDNNCGILIDSIEDIASSLSKLEAGQYQEMKENAARIGKLIREGHYLIKAMRSVVSDE